MKFLVLLAVLAVAYLLWRQARLKGPDRDTARPPAVAPPQDMVSCALCGVHLPRPEAVSGHDGTLYCSHDHRQSAAGGP